MNNLLSKTIFFLFTNFGRRKKKWENYDLLCQTQYYDDEKLAEFQNHRLNTLLKCISVDTIYYKNLFKSNGLDSNLITVDSLNKIPFLTKEIIKEHLNELLNKNIASSRVRSNSTSGSSGEKTIFYRDRDSDYFKAPLNWRSLKWLDIDFGDKELRIWGSRRDVNLYSKKINNYLNNYRILSSYKLNDKIISDYIRFINSYKPDQIHAYPSSLYEISKNILKNEYRIYKPKAILTSGEQLYEWQREKIRKAFGTDVFAFYGCREVNIIAQECKAHKGLHIMAENILLEVVNKKGENVFDEEGEIVVTDLSNYVFPFIRYKILDRGVLTKEKCTCGLNLPLLKSIQGRTFDLIKFKNGGSLGATFFTILLKERPGIESFKIFQDKINEIIIEYTSDGRGDESDFKYFENKIKNKSDHSLEVKFKKVHNINIPDSGKKQFIFSKL